MKLCLPFSALVCAVALAALAPPAAAQWKWKDASGRINVSDLPPPREIPPQDILQRPAPPVLRPAVPASGPAAAKPVPASDRRVDRELQVRKEAAAQAQAARERADAARLAAQRAENCRRARAQLAALESGQRMVRFNEKGEREIIDDAQRAAEVRRVTDVMASECR